MATVTFLRLFWRAPAMESHPDRDMRAILLRWKVY
jgi:hypothetical protein